MKWLLLALALLALVLAAAWILRDEPGPVGLHAPAAVPAARPEDAEPRDVDALAPGTGGPTASGTRTEAPAAPVEPAQWIVHVLDREDERPLAGIEVWRSDAPVRRRRGSETRLRVGGTPAPSGPSGSDERLRHALSSPFVLELGDDTPEALWIAVEGYLPFRLVHPAHAGDGDLWVHLERACGLELRLAGAAFDPQLARVRLYGPTPAAAEPAGDWREERPAQRALRFAALEPGTWCATVEQRVGERGQWAILAQARAELARGEWRTLALDVLEPQVALEPAILTLRFPPMWLAEPGAEAQLVPGPSNAGRLGADHRLDALVEPTWGPIGLVPGRYALVLEPGRIEFPIELAPGETRELDVPEVPLCDVAIRILDEVGAPLDPVEWVGWRSTLAWNGGPASLFSAPFRVVAHEDVLRLRVAAAPLELAVFSRPAGSLRSVVVEPCVVGELEVRLPAETRLELALEGLEDELDLDWLGRVRLRLDGVLLEGVARNVTERDGRIVATLSLERAGTLDLELPPLASHGSLRPRRVHLGKGQTQRLTLGPEDLARPTLERR
jgi:hypothetical protein